MQSALEGHIGVVSPRAGEVGRQGDRGWERGHGGDVGRLGRPRSTGYLQRAQPSLAMHLGDAKLCAEVTS